MIDEAMDCDELVERVTEYLDSALDAPTRTRLDAHLAECPGCVEILEQFRAVVTVTGALRPSDAATVEPARREELLRLFRAAAG